MSLDKEPKITIEVGLAQLLALTVYPDYDAGGETVGHLVAEHLARTATSERAIWNAVQEEVRRKVGELVAAAFDAPPSSDNTLHQLIIREVRAQLGPEASYQGTATPMAQWVSAEVYKVIREAAMPVIDQVRAQADIAAQQAVRDEFDRRWPR